jgi:hypothetical protein
MSGRRQNPQSECTVFELILNVFTSAPAPGNLEVGEQSWQTSFGRVSSR